MPLSRVLLHLPLERIVRELHQVDKAVVLHDYVLIRRIRKFLFKHNIVFRMQNEPERHFVFYYKYEPHVLESNGIQLIVNDDVSIHHPKRTEMGQFTLHVQR